MPSVDWQAYLEDSIDNITAVVVLWTPESRGSDSVRDEARLGLDKRKLVNVLHGVDKPRFPADRINGLSIEGWVAGVPHQGWSRVVGTLDQKLAAAGEIASPGLLKAALAAQLQTVAERERAIAQCAQEIKQAGRARDGRLRDLAPAESRLDAAEAQLAGLKTIATTKGVMDAAWADRDQAKTELGQVKAAVAEAEAAFEGHEERLKDLSARHAEFLVSIGGEEQNGRPAPPPGPGGTPSGGEPPGPGPVVGPRPPPVQPGKPWIRAALGGLAVAGVAVAVTWAVSNSAGQAPRPPGPGRIVRAEAPAPAPKAEVAPPSRVAWLTQSWVVNQATKGCSLTLDISLSAGGDKLAFKSSAAKKPFELDFTMSPSGLAVETKDSRYESVSPTKVRVISKANLPESELSKCDR